MSDPQTQQQTDFSSHESRIAALEQAVMNRFYGVEQKAIGFWSKANRAYQYLHSELYNWGSHAKDVAYVLAALGIFVLCAKMAGIA